MTPLELNIARLESVSREVAPILPGCRAWAAIDPFVADDAYKPERPPTIRIRVRIVEIPIHELERRGWDLEGDEDFIAVRLDVVADDAASVAAILTAAGIGCEDFDPSYRSRMPF